ncbi:MAG: hypothetical protein WC627_07380 [Legionella sp.]
MLLVRKILSIPERILAGILGMVVFPLRSLWFSAAFMGQIAVSIAKYDWNYLLKLFSYISSEPIRGFLLSPFMVAGVAITSALSMAGYAVTVAVIAVATAIQLSIWPLKGLSIGLASGLKGFLSEWKHGRSPFFQYNRLVNAPVNDADFHSLEERRRNLQNIGRSIRIPPLPSQNNIAIQQALQINRINTDHNIAIRRALQINTIDTDRLNNIANNLRDMQDRVNILQDLANTLLRNESFVMPNNLVDVVVPRRPTTLGTEEPQHEINVLSTEEVQNVTALLDSFKEFEKNPLAPEIKGRLNKYRQLVNQYSSLSERLNKLQFALETGSLDDVDDELINNGLKNPILVVKQYLSVDGQWKTVPTISHIADRDALLNWLIRNPTHPITRDIFKSPPDYVVSETETCPTRYRWFRLTKEYCYAPELGEIADTLRALMQTLPQELGMTNNSVSAGSSRHSLFSQPNGANDNGYEEELLGLNALGL